MVSFTEYRLFGEGAAGSPVDGKGECMTFAIARIARRSAAFSRARSPPTCRWQRLLVTSRESNG
jgi:hypothetical protein